MTAKQNHDSSTHATAWLTGTVQALVDDPGAVDVQTIEGGTTTILEVKVAGPDVRRVIGKKGRTADALRQLLLNLGAKGGRRYHLEIVEPDHRQDEIPGDAGLGVPVKVERRSGGRILISAEHGD